MATTRGRWRFFLDGKKSRAAIFSRPCTVAGDKKRRFCCLCQRVATPVLVCETQRLLIRRLDATDAPFILRLLNEPSFLQNIGDRGVRSLDDARTYLAKGPLASYAQHGFGLFHVSLKAGGDAIGMCGLLKRDWLDAPDVGFAFLPEFWSKGYAPESSVGVIE